MSLKKYSDNSITQKKSNSLEKKVASLEQENLMLNDIINGIEANIYWKDLNGRVSGINKFQEQNLAKINLKPEQVIGKTSEEIFSNAEIAHSHSDNDMQIIEHGKSLQIEEKNISNKKEYIYLSRKSPLKNKDGKIYGLLGVAIDITERKRLEEETKHQKEQLELKEKLKKEFISNFSHDIKLPINAIISRFELMKMKVFYRQDDELIKLIEEVDESIMALNNLFEQMHNVMINEKFGRKIYYTSFDLHDLIINESRIAQASIKTPDKINFSVNIKKFFSKVSGDYVRTSQILRNVLSNAVKYTEQGKICLDVSLLEDLDNKILVKFVISDTGVGIRQQDFHKIYNLGQRLVQSYKSSQPGLGLGLYLVKSHLTILGGSIDFESSYGHGAKFWIEIPFKKQV